jgi:dTDP-N-acetylfucosamine:lipid II N-acetylfucosaminyltransferase
MLIILFDDAKFLSATARAFLDLDAPPIRYLYAGRLSPDQGLGLGLVHGRDLFDLGNADTLWGLAPGKVAVFIQGLSIPNTTAFMMLKSRVNASVVIWRCFGADFYYNFYRRPLYEPLTAGLLRRGFDLKSRLKTIPGVAEVNRRIRTAPVRRIIEHDVTHVAPILSYEYYLIREVLDLTAAYVRFTGCVRFSPMLQTGENYLLGNSADPANNHLDALEELRQRVSLSASQRVIVPLSYGNPAYARRVIRRGRDLFGEAFEPLTDFLPLAQYHEKMASCRHIILNHRRQQAVGNLVVALWNGASVYLNARNPAYAHFKDFLQADVFAIEALGTQPKVNAAQNQAIVESQYGRAMCRRNAEYLMSLVP